MRVPRRLPAKELTYAAGTGGPGRHPGSIGVSSRTREMDRRLSIASSSRARSEWRYIRDDAPENDIFIRATIDRDTGILPFRRCNFVHGS